MVWYSAPGNQVCHPTFMTLFNAAAEAMTLLQWWRVRVSWADPDARN